MKTMRESTLKTLGLGSVLEIFQSGKLPVNEAEMVEQVFGAGDDRGALVISGGNGIVGSGKAMQLGSRLYKYNVPIITLDLPNSPDGIGQQYPGLRRAFGGKTADEIMSNIIRLNYDGKNIPSALKKYKPRFLLEAIPEFLNLKKEHYALFRGNFKGIEIRSVTSGFPSSELGVGILHPSFPHQINKIWEVVEAKPSDITRMLWALGLIPIPVGDYWSFILDVLFCGITLAGLRYHRKSNMPFWKIDKCIRKYVGPNPYRAHDVIGPGANFLTWSCLHHLSEKYGEVFKPAEELNRRKDSGETWYSSNRPIVDWQLEDDEEFQILVLGALFQMTGLVLKEKRGQLSYINAIGELCAQFTKGILALMRGMGPERVIELVQKYHKLHPEASQKSWYPEVFEGMDSPEWGQLYVNAEHNGEVGIITISREALNWEVIEELNRAIDWLKMEGIQRVILTGDFHLSTQMIGADTTEFFPALEKEEAGKKVSLQWSQTARRFYDEFEVSVGFIQGKRGLGGMLELMMHCHYLISVDDAQLGMPEVTLPVVPGMEGCHWALRKASRSDYPKLIDLLLSGKSLSAKETVPWLADYSGTMEQALKMAWKIVSGKEFDIKPRKVAEPQLDIADCLSRAGEKYKFTPAQKAIFDCIKASCSVPLSQAIEVQARHSAGFMLSRSCQKGVIGRNFEKMGKI